MTPKLLHLMVFGAAFLLCLLLTPLVRAAARRGGLVDAPDGRRKTHAGSIPVAGGLAVLLTTLTVLGALLFAPDSWNFDLGDRWRKFAGLAVAAVIIAAVGVADDFRSLR